MRTIRSVLTSMTRSPVKSAVTLSTVGLGVGVLIFALSISGAFSRLVSEQLEKEGLVVMVANVEIDEEGEMQQVRPPQFDANVTQALRSGVSGAVAASPVAMSACPGSTAASIAAHTDTSAAPKRMPIPPWWCREVRC